jgi:hypothetical protein
MLGSAMLASQSRATTVEYSTAGSFAAAGSDSTSGTGDTTLNSASNNFHLSFAGAPQNTYDVPADNPVSLGDFTLSWSAGTESFNTSDKFTMTITQQLPGGGSSTSQALVTGTLSQSGRRESATVTLNFDTNPIVIVSPANTSTAYELVLNPFTFSGLNLNKNASVTSEIDANVNVVNIPPPVTAVPLPAATPAGCALLSVLGALKLRRNRRDKNL